MYLEILKRQFLGVGLWYGLLHIANLMPLQASYDKSADQEPPPISAFTRRREVFVGRLAMSGESPLKRRHLSFAGVMP